MPHEAAATPGRGGLETGKPPGGEQASEADVCVCERTAEPGYRSKGAGRD